MGEVIAVEADAAEGRLSPSSGVMVQAVWFDAGAERAGRLWLSIHHLAVDGVSWRILLPDLAAAWTAIAAGQEVSGQEASSQRGPPETSAQHAGSAPLDALARAVAALPVRGTSFRRWSELLSSDAQSERVTRELSFWSGMQRQPSLLLVEKRLDPERDTLGVAGHLSLTLPGAVTEALLTRVPAAFHGGINDVLLTGLALAVADWCRRKPHRVADGVVTQVHPVRSASHAVLLDLEGHGREEGLGGEDALGGDIDLTRTVGWFTSLYPVRLDPGALDLDEALAGGPALGRALKIVKEQLRAVPGKGLGYGLLRYLNAETASALAGAPVPQLSFNYLGRFAGGGEGADWAPADMVSDMSADMASDMSAGDAQGTHGARQDARPHAHPRGGDAAMPLAHAIEIDALTLDGVDGPVLTANWTFAPALLDEAEVRDLAESWFRALSALARHAAQPGAGGWSPSDLPLVDLTQGEIDQLEHEAGAAKGKRSGARGHPAAVAAAGGAAVPCAVRCAGTGRLYGAA